MNAETHEKVVFDTSVLLPALVSWHDNHPEAVKALRDALDVAVVSIPSRVLIETYSVMTRLPPPRRLSPSSAWLLLSANLRDRVEIVEFPQNDRWPLLETLADRGVAGGRVYDAEIVEMARWAGATKIVSFNRSHFESLVGEIELIVP